MHLSQAGIEERDALIYRRGRFSPWRFALSGTGWQAWRTRASTVAVLWNDASGFGQLNVAMTASLLSRRVIAVLPDGTLKESTWREPLVIALKIRWQPIAERVRRWWQQVGHRWDALRLRVEGPQLEPRIWHSHYLSDVLNRRDLPPLGRMLSGTVLDVGAGTGHGARYLDATRTRYLPTDLPTGRDCSDADITRSGMRPRVQCSGAALPFADASVDGVMALSVLEHVRDAKAVLDEAFRVLRPGGRLFVQTPFGFPFHGEPNDFWRWTVEGLNEQLRRSGFEPEVHRRSGSSLTTIVINLHMTVKYAWRQADSATLRLISRWAWPLVLPWQVLLNLVAKALDPLESNPPMPCGLAVVARRPDRP